MEQARALRVLVVDDHLLIRRVIRSILTCYSDLHIVGEAGDGLEAILLVDKHRPDIVLMDISMPKMNGVEATAQIMSRYPDTIIIGLSVNTGTVNQAAMTRVGADQLIRKEAAVDQLYGTIRDAVRKRELSDYAVES